MKDNLSNNELILFQSSDNEVKLQVIIDNNDDTVWVNQNELTLLFGKAKRTIGEHISNIYSEEELDKKSPWRKSRLVQLGGNRKVERIVN